MLEESRGINGVPSVVAKTGTGNNSVTLSVNMIIFQCG